MKTLFHKFRELTCGACVFLGAMLISLGTVAPFVATETPIGPLMRIFDSLAPWFLVMGLGFAILVVLLGMRWLGTVLIVMCVLAGGFLYAQHRVLSLPIQHAANADLRVVFLNTLRENAAFSHRIVEAAVQTNPDVLIFAEAESLYPALRRLRSEFEFVTPCKLGDCELLFAVRKTPTRFWTLNLNLVWGQRYGVVQFETDAGKSVSVVANHLLKPWLSGVSESELARLAAQYDWLTGPVVVVGDFNMAPWSLPMRELLQFTGFRALRMPVPTWPAGAGALGVPIDHVLVHNGARVVAVEPFGDGLGSNHRGLLVDIALP